MSGHVGRAQTRCETIFCSETTEITSSLAEKDIKVEISKLVKAGIIQKMPPDVAAKWSSPAGFMAKDPREERLRLVFDARMLNKSVPTDSSIFPTPSEIMQNLSADSKFFVKADILQGYHQLPLAKQSQNLFCFKYSF